MESFRKIIRQKYDQKRSTLSLSCAPFLRPCRYKRPRSSGCSGASRRSPRRVPTDPNALACIDAHLRAGRPVIVGVYVNGRAPYWANPDGCQHFVVITEKTSNGYRFVDCGTRFVDKGCSTQNIFTVDWTNRRMNGYTAASTNYHNIVITHIRPNM